MDRAELKARHGIITGADHPMYGYFVVFFFFLPPRNQNKAREPEQRRAINDSVINITKWTVRRVANKR